MRKVDAHSIERVRILAELQTRSEDCATLDWIIALVEKLERENAALISNQVQYVDVTIKIPEFDIESLCKPGILSNTPAGRLLGAVRNELTSI